jgi:branched-subunit amino acid aminotransferase/4-amino-4-deoxychorismate lyase
MATVFLNGSFISRDDARISAFDAGLQHAVGLFETMTAVRRRPPQRNPHSTPHSTPHADPDPTPDPSGGFEVIHLRPHLDRLARSARDLGLAESLRLHALEDAIAHTLRHAAADMPSTPRLRLRLTLTGGDLNLLDKARDPGSPHDSITPTLLIVAQPATRYPDELFSRGGLATIADLKLNPLNPFESHKTLNYWPRLRELQLAAAKRAAEALVFQVSNHLAGGCVSSVLLVKHGRILTPLVRGEELESHLPDDPDSPISSKGAYLPSPILPSVTRQWALDWADAELIDVEKRLLTIDDVLAADELLLANSSWGILPITRVERAVIGDGAVGPVAAALIAAWNDLTRATP